MALSEVPVSAGRQPVAAGMSGGSICGHTGNRAGVAMDEAAMVHCLSAYNAAQTETGRYCQRRNSPTDSSIRQCLKHSILSCKPVLSFGDAASSAPDRVASL
jgi:hypothetical protein